MTGPGRMGVKLETKISPGSVQPYNAAVLLGHSPCGMSLRTNAAWYESNLSRVYKGKNSQEAKVGPGL